VLIVNDDVAALERAANALLVAGWDVARASNGTAALELAKELAPDVVVIQLQTPRMSGRELCAVIRSTPTLLAARILVLSEAAEAESVADYGADSTVTTPIPEQALCREVQRLLSVRREIGAQECDDAGGAELRVELQRSVEVVNEQANRLERLVHGLGAARAERRVPTDTPQPKDAEARARILVADADPVFLDALRELLCPRYDLTVANDGCDALARLHAEPYELAMLELRDLAELSVPDQFRRNGRAAPSFMFFSGEPMSTLRARGFTSDTAEIVTKPVDPEEFLARVARVIAIAQRERGLVAEAMSDHLTGLPNYRSLAINLERELDHAKFYDLPLSLLTIDLDDLKGINDELGHGAGDDAIRLVANVLQGAVRRIETVARQGGDELAIIVPNTSNTEALHLAQRLCSEVATLSIGGRALSISVGVATREPGDDATSARSLFDASDRALYGAKRGGRNRASVEHRAQRRLARALP
jgi:diguanylate cyclase (GGDEF)-like protein